MRPHKGKSAFSIFHPLVPIFYLIVVLVFVMACREPVIAALSLVAAIVYSFILKGVRSTLLMLAWQVPMLLIITVLNPVFSASGSTMLFMPFGHPIYLESLVFGLVSGLMLVAVLEWFSNLDAIVDADQLMSLGSSVLPTISLMISMVLRLVPQFLQRGHQIADVQAACSAAADPETGKRATLREGARRTSMLMGWGMEDSLDMALAMKARGWGSGAHRSSYRRRSFRVRDAIALAIIVALTLLSALAAWQLRSTYLFYPVLSSLGAWWLYMPYALLLLFPFVLEIKEWLHWR